MRKNRVIGAIALLAAGALALSGCGSEPSGGGDASGGTSVLPAVAKDVKLEGSPTFDRAVKAGKIVIGVKNDQPGLGFEDLATGKRDGFDVDTARWIAGSLGFTEEQIEWKTIPSANRETEIAAGNVDFYVGTYSITDKRKEQINFAGPYFITGQGLLVAKDNTDINGPDDLKGKTVCSVTGSTPLQRVRDEYNPGKAVEYKTYSQCVEQLLQGQVDAITTDEAILAGYVAEKPNELKLAGEPFSEEKYGVGLAKGDEALTKHINDLFTNGGDTWTALYKEYLEPAGVKATQPKVEE